MVRISIASTSIHVIEIRDVGWLNHLDHKAVAPRVVADVHDRNVRRQAVVQARAVASFMDRSALHLISGVSYRVEVGKVDVDIGPFERPIIKARTAFGTAYNRRISRV